MPQLVVLAIVVVLLAGGYVLFSGDSPECDATAGCQAGLTQPLTPSPTTRPASTPRATSQPSPTLASSPVTPSQTPAPAAATAPVAAPEVTAPPAATPTPTASSGNVVTITNGAGYSNTNPQANTTYECGPGVVLDGRGAKFAFTGTASNVTIQNCEIRGYNSGFQEGAIRSLGEGWLIQNNDIHDNSHGGIDGGGNNTVIRNNHVHHNGMYGIAGGDGANLLIEGNEVSYNNTANFDAGFEGGGGKVTEANGLIIRNNTYHHNFGPGIWSDENVINAIIENNNVYENTWVGIFYEISAGAVIRNNTLTNNGFGDPRGAFWRSQIIVAASNDVLVEGNVVSQTCGDCGGMVVVQQDRGSHFAYRVSLRDNRVEGDSGFTCDAGPQDVPAATCQAIASTISFDGNFYTRGVEIDFYPHDNLSFSAFQALGHEANGGIQ
ncbi:MAG TPA: right-handed parallel beta-helix repeat-containing protein [Dehalococcoidia bacterium]|nr:right-handed parallel beta-helix repeat-containing protein [Dehalococcoidia bacterium]